MLSAVADYVILDCDGVLVDSEPLSNQALAETLTELGVPYTREECVRDFMGRSWRHVEERVGVVDGLRDRYRARMLAAFERELRVVPGVEAALDAIALPMCVASSGEPEKMRWTLGHTGLLERFDGRLFSAEAVEHGKPAPDLFLHAARTLGWARERCAVVEDSPAGVEAGRAAGMHVLGFARMSDPDELRARGAGVVFSDMAELPGLLAPVARSGAGGDRSPCDS